ncbi:planctomycete cytochrome c : Protein containing planctomycete cytochrome C domain protein OS=Rhodopirellula baltica SWK14 GN=RBSWK_03829 PE=4 SV=1: PSCyt1 [Gemmata massiliana]|uniref:Cytochrome c domain-containing protein n=1 Tax=Gemmata massiliana TaxID=1210884 RepID=A0A6P2D889_9BACT|nr:c-type cytochrome domain-containing protein [Gemmata massiliana]VTR95690.1 planctomycete cytochrome c : Protein containing planctomycete cytochrome C domain protein OS=Rhodopirellula baltica SWK14 GN=RBSWK_03829 PE=4 SV=1: PSCyt1 [Gemmata massiliana]
MARRYQRGYDSDDLAPVPAGGLSSNGQWLFGSLYAALILIGFSFGVWAGASKPKTFEVAEAKKEPAEKPDRGAPPVKPVTPPPAEPKTNPMPPVEQKPVEREPEPKPPEPKKEPEVKPAEPKPKEPAPKPPEPKPPEPKKVNVKPVSFKEVSKVFVAHCNNCHGSVGKPKAGIDLRTVAAILKGGADGDIVKPGDPEKSVLYLSLMADASKPMPPDGKQRPTEAEIKLVHDWIASGAKQRRRPVRGRRGFAPARFKNYSPNT